MDEKIFETTIILDKEKVEQCPYTEESIYQYLEQVFDSVDMVRNHHTFKQGTCAMVGVAMVSLFKVEWFMKLVKEWTLTAKDGENVIVHENVFESKAVRVKYLDKYGI